MNGIKDLIESNRQTGATTRLVTVVQESEGVLVVGTMEIANNLKDRWPGLRCVTLGQIKNGYTRGISKTPIFFDLSAVVGLDDTN